VRGEKLSQSIDAKTMLVEFHCMLGRLLETSMHSNHFFIEGNFSEQDLKRRVKGLIIV